MKHNKPTIGLFLLLFIIIVLLFLSGAHKAHAQDNFSVILSQQETTYAYRAEEKRNRADNVELAASRINGAILQPEEIFSYNGLVGARTEKNGFKEAPEIIRGDLVDGIGGGVCQVSGTTHAAMLYAGMTIIESTQHSRHSVYIDPGLDSTVSWPRLDLKMQNNYPFPVKIVAETYRDKKKGHLIVRVLGKKQMFRTEVVSEIHKKEKYKTKKIFRRDLKKGYRKMIEPGTYKIKMTRTRRIYRIDNGSLILEETLNLHYNDSDRVFIIGLGPKE